MMKNKNAIILLSGGLDSLVSVALSQKDYNISCAIHFDYGQNPSKKELESSKKICEYFKINLKVIKLDWLADLAKDTALCSNKASKDKKSFWIPNRNGLFVNIASCFAEANNCKYVIIGANKEEAQVFKDNSEDFIKKTTKALHTSTQNNVNLIAPLINLTKEQIIKKAIAVEAPLELVWSCYNNNEKHCGECPSCLLFKSALSANNRQDLQKLLF